MQWRNGLPGRGAGGGRPSASQQEYMKEAFARGLDEREALGLLDAMEEERPEMTRAQICAWLLEPLARLTPTRPLPRRTRGDDACPRSVAPPRPGSNRCARRSRPTSTGTARSAPRSACTCTASRSSTCGAAPPTRTTGRPWERDTLQLVYSTTKGVIAACANLLAQRGELDLDAPVAKYWPEFAAAGKADIPVRWLLTHQAGLPRAGRAAHPAAEALAWDPMVEALAAQRPVWEPGTGHGYHGLTYGWLVGEVVRRATGRTIGRFLPRRSPSRSGSTCTSACPSASTTG